MQGTFGWNRTISATMLNEFRINFTRFAFDQRQPVGDTNFGIPAISLFDFDAGGLGDIGTFLGSITFSNNSVFGFTEHLRVGRNSELDPQPARV